MPSLRNLVLGPDPSYLDEFVAAARDRAARRRARARARRESGRPARGLILRPGPDTPLWNELVRLVRPRLRRRGAQNQLARLLGISRQRLYVCLRAQRACLDAERTLLLLMWVSARHRGRDIVA
jgi:DNA invertase Pin-like site-specific DNA recombinase